MTSTIVVPQGFSYVGAALVATSFLTMWQAFGVVGPLRRKAGVAYPQAYAEKALAAASADAMRFNCAQRAHQNTLELLPAVVVSTVITGLKYPVPAAAACAVWILGRVFYTLNYSSGDPTKRGAGGARLGSLSFAGLMLASIWTTANFVIAGL